VKPQYPNDNDSTGVLQRLQAAVLAETGVRLDLAATQRIHEVCVARPHQAIEPAAALQEVTVLMTDLRGFSAIMEAHPAQVVLDMLNRFLTRMCEIAIANGGTIDKFMGDAVMVLFGAPSCHADDALRAVTCAVQMQLAMEDLNREHASLELPPLYMGAGLNTGDVMVGRLGSELHSEYTVIGNKVNIASRIEAFSLRGQVLVSETTYERCAGYLAVGQPMDVHVKGNSQPVRLREAFGIPSLGLEIPRQDVRKSPRVQAQIAFTYQPIIDKIVMPPLRQGIMLDLSYEGVLAEVEPGLELYSDLHLVLDMSMVGSRSHNIYAKVRTVRTEQGHHYAGIEFTSISPESAHDIRHLVQLLIQGSPLK
jgi:adenylate cyclase